MLNEQKVLYSSPNNKLYNRKKEHLLDNRSHSIKDMTNNKILLNNKNQKSEKNIIRNALIKRRIYLSSNKKELKNLNIEKICSDYKNCINNINNSKSINYDMKSNSKFRINSQKRRL